MKYIIYNSVFLLFHLGVDEFPVLLGYSGPLHAGVEEQRHSRGKLHHGGQSSGREHPAPAGVTRIPPEETVQGGEQRGRPRLDRHERKVELFPFPHTFQDDV